MNGPDWHIMRESLNEHFCARFLSSSVHFTRAADWIEKSSLALSLSLTASRAHGARALNSTHWKIDKSNEKKNG